MVPGSIACRDKARHGMGYRSIDPVEQLVRLPDFHACARTLIDDTPTESIFLEMLPPPKRINNRPHRLFISPYKGSATKHVY